MFQNELDLTVKTASTNSPWAYIQEGLSSERYLRLRLIGGLIFRRTFFFWGGGAYRNFMVVQVWYRCQNANLDTR